MRILKIVHDFAISILYELAKIISYFSRLNDKDKFEIFFFDPPFSENFFIEDLKIMRDSKVYKKKHLIIIHREEKSQDNLDNIINILLTKKYGRSKVIFGEFLT